MTERVFEGSVSRTRGSDAMIRVSNKYRAFRLGWPGTEAYRFKMASCCACVCVSWRLASEIVAGENRLVMFCSAILPGRA